MFLGGRGSGRVWSPGAGGRSAGASKEVLDETLLAVLLEFWSSYVLVHLRDQCEDPIDCQRQRRREDNCPGDLLNIMAIAQVSNCLQTVVNLVSQILQQKIFCGEKLVTSVCRREMNFLNSYVSSHRGDRVRHTSYFSHLRKNRLQSCLYT